MSRCGPVGIGTYESRLTRPSEIALDESESPTDGFWAACVSSIHLLNTRWNGRRNRNSSSVNHLTSQFAPCDSVRSLDRSEEHTSELQSRSDLVCRLLLEKKKKKK